MKNILNYINMLVCGLTAKKHVDGFIYIRTMGRFSANVTLG